MKKLLIALLLVCSAANAEKWGETRNGLGGKILLLMTTCDAKTDGRVAISTNPAGTNISGCWFYFSDMVHIVWTDGTVSSYDAGVFAVKESK